VSFQPAVSHVEVQLVNGCCGAVRPAGDHTTFHCAIVKKMVISQLFYIWVSTGYSSLWTRTGYSSLP